MVAHLNSILKILYSDQPTIGTGLLLPTHLEYVGLLFYLLGGNIIMLSIKKYYYLIEIKYIKC